MAVKRLNRRRIGGGAAPMVSANIITASAPKITIPQSQTATPAARAAQTDFAGQADGVNTARINVNKAGDIVGGEFGFGTNVQKYDPKKIAWVMGRGASGGSLSRADQAVYDRMMYLRAQKTAQEQQDAAEKKATDAAHAEDERKRKLDAAEWDRQNAVRTKQAQDAKIAEEKRRNEEYDRRVKAERDYKAEQQQAALDAENAKYEALNKKYGIAEGTRLSDKDYGDLEAGRSKWGYSREDQQAVDSINADYDEAMRSRKFGDKQKVDRNGTPVLGTDPEGKTEAEWLKLDRDESISRFEKRLVPNDQPQTAEQIYNGSFAAPDGTRLIANGSGGLVAIPGTGPQKEVETPEQKQTNAIEKERRAYVLKQIEDARKSWNSVDEQIDDPRGSNYGSIPNPNYGKPFDPTEAIKAANANWTSVIGGNPAPSVKDQNPQGGGATPAPSATTSQNDWRNNPLFK